MTVPYSGFSNCIQCWLLEMVLVAQEGAIHYAVKNLSVTYSIAVFAMLS